MNCRGMALLTGLVLLAAVSILAITAAGSMTLQQHQAANFAGKSLGRAEAERAESWAIAWLFSQAGTGRQPGCITDCLLPGGLRQDSEVPDDPEFRGGAWWQANGSAAGRHPLSGASVGYAEEEAPDALWIIEEIHFEPTGTTGSGIEGTGYYRIFARGSGNHPGSVTVTEAIVARPWGADSQAASFPPEAPLSSFCSQFGTGLHCGVQSWRQRR